MIINTIAVAAASRHTTRVRRCSPTRRITSDLNRGDAVARGNCRIALPMSSSFMVSSDPPRFQVAAHVLPSPEDSRLHCSDPAPEGARDLVVWPFFNFEQHQRRTELDRQAVQRGGDFVLNLVG